MSPDTVVAIAAILIGALISYHIAIRQGLFRSARLAFTLGLPPYDLPSKGSVWALLYAIPNIIVDRYLVVLPYLLLSKGSQPLHNVRVQMILPTRRSPIGLNTMYKGILDSSRFPGIQRTVRPLGDVVVIDHQHPVIRPGEGIAGGEILQYSREELYPSETNDTLTRDEESPHLIADTIHVDVIAENHRKFDWRGLVAAVAIRSVADLRSVLPGVAIDLKNRVQTGEFPTSPSLWQSLTGSPYANRHCLLVEPEFTRSVKGIAIEEILAGGPPSGHQLATIGFVLRTRIRFGR